ncbi:galactonate dehydratase [Staphylococcus equorum]|uniref:galactonate dehydratase n=1 Tax=Staphylococcus equorum TaxID=246432 RepID=UPI003EB8358C
MKIIDFKLYQVPPRWLFLKITTDEGIEGWGEPVIEGKASTVKTAVSELMNQLIGKDPSNIEGLWDQMYRSSFYRGGPILMSAISGIDQALWDIKGKYLNAPVHQLLGGKARDRIKVYSWVGGDRPEDVAREAEKVAQKGFTAIKMNATEELQYLDDYSKVEAVLKRVHAIRDKLGDDFGIGIDFHGRVHKPMAKILTKELEKYHPLFIEEPVLSEHNDYLKQLAQYSVPIATGERMYSRYDFKKLLNDGYIDVIQPDLSHAGGITECKKIISMAEAYDVAAAPHCPLGPIALAACLQVDATCHNAIIQEQSLGIHYNKSNDLLDYIKNPQVFEYAEGYVKIPEGPGLGIEINEEYIAERNNESHK